MSSYDIFYNLLVTLACGFIVSALKYVWNYLKHPPTDTTSCDVAKARKDFFIALIMIVAGALIPSFIDYEVMLILCRMLLFFGLLISWGAFDAIHAQLNKLEQELTEKNSESSNE